MSRSEQQLSERVRTREPSHTGRNTLAIVLGVLLALVIAAIALFFLLGGDVDLDADAEVDAPNVEVEEDDAPLDEGR